MSISSVGTAFQQTLIDNETSSSQKTVKKELGKEDFLTLLVAQLKNQDPLNPMESADFTAQLAQFSSLEQLFGIKDALGNIQSSIAAQGAQEDKNLLDYIGKMVKTGDNILSLKDGKADLCGYILEEPAKEVTISIFDRYGVKVRTIEEGEKIAGQYTVDWDGRDNDGDQLDDGVYTFDVQPIDENGEEILSYTHAQGEVTGVTYEGSIPYLIVGNRQVLPENILAITKLNEQ